MPKGRIFVPSPDNDGIWYRHRGIPEQGSFIRVKDTTTGFMMEEPFTNSDYPPSPPRPYHLKNNINFSTSNKFSDHDNRNSFQDHGVYFENGHDSRQLGRKIRSSTDRHHFTPKEYLHHDSVIPTPFDYNTTYGKTYEGRPNSEPVRRHFPNIYKQPKEGTIELPTTTTKWEVKSSQPKPLPIQVLARSQVPYLKRNNWKYSNHGLANCYPALRL